MISLYVNLDHVATIREARGTSYPSVVDAALLAEATGLVEGITLHLREDRRHVNDDDMRTVGRLLRLPLNFEMSIAKDIVQVCREVSPVQATLVPERREELTTEGGLDLVAAGDRLRDVTLTLQDDGIIVSLFIDPDPDTIRRSKDLGATHVELHTGRYADAEDAAAQARELEILQEGARIAAESGLVLNVGHGLTHENVGPLMDLPGLQDLNIGHAIVARSIFIGLPGALKEMREAMDRGAGCAATEGA